jgi:MFS family permease
MSTSVPSDPGHGQPPDSQRAAETGPYGTWRNPSFRLYAASWFLITFGKQIETVAVGVHLYSRTEDPMSLGWLGLVQALPVMLLAIAGGQLADRFDRRRILFCAMLVSSLVSVGLIGVAYWQASLQWIYLLLALGATSQALGSPSRAALLPQIVGPVIFSSAVAWNSTVFQIAVMTGPAIGGLILGAKEDILAAFLAVAACRIGSLVCIAFLRSRPAERSQETVSIESLLAGVRFVWREKLILAPITLDLFAVLFGGLTYLLPVFARDILQVDARGLGLLRSAEAVGAVTMALLIAHLPPMRRAGFTMLWSVAGFGAATVTFGLSTSFWLSLAMMFVIGALDNVSVVVRHTLVQVLTPDKMRGRVSAVNNVFIVASNDLGGLESGLTAWLVGPVISVVGGGIGTILVVLGATRLWPQLLKLGSLRDLRPLEAAQVQEETDEELAARG